MNLDVRTVDALGLGVHAAGEEPQIEHLIDGIPGGLGAEPPPMEDASLKEGLVGFRAELVNSDLHVSPEIHPVCPIETK